MAIRRILQLGDPTLRLKSEPVATPADAAPILSDLDDTLAEFRRSHGFGRGISAIQIGVPARVIFLRVDGRPYSLVNPSYLWKSDTRFELWDDCFSFPDLMVRLTRHHAVRINYLDAAFHPQSLDAQGPLAELIQHEMDHLDGILALDRAANPSDWATREEWTRRFGPAASSTPA